MRHDSIGTLLRAGGRANEARYDFDIAIKEITYSVETVTDPKTGQTVRASTHLVGDCSGGIRGPITDESGGLKR